ncbi:MAG TPA: prepilin-type N-terminal cleavage/methylation domain-containing protein [Acidimicrobiia bacterium]|nr:prepilin-type N-terminal cleavage/methylation domain-containing protein [Acidimicrobiia bacterium]
MLNSVRERREHEEGFTLIELMVVVLIIAILIAIAIPTFLGARDSANDRAAQSSLRNGLTAAKTLYTDVGDWTTATKAALEGVEPSLTFEASPTVSGNAKTVSFAVAAGSQTIALAGLSKAGECFWVRDTAVADATYTKAGTFYGKNTTACTGTNALAAGGAGW